MSFPAFFDAVAPITLRDPLADLLGAAEDGVIEYSYSDAVKLAGHSCPTVAGAYGVTRAALSALYRDKLPMRGDIAVAFREALDVGVTGVVANVVGLLTGAAAEGGFKGLGGRFSRRKLLRFEAAIPLDLRFTRLDNGAAVDVRTDLSGVAAAPEMADWMRRALADEDGAEARGIFAGLWQDRVRRILTEHLDDPAVFIVRPVAGPAGGP